MDFDSKEIYFYLKHWIEKNDFKSYDQCDVKGLDFYLRLSEITQGTKYGKYFSYPIQLFVDYNLSTFRNIFKVDKRKYPQAQAFIARSYLKYYRRYKDEAFLQKALEILDWLKKNPSPDQDYFCWGQPYHWYSGKVMPAFTPRTTVTSQVANAFLDAYEMTQKKALLSVAESACDAYCNVINEIHDQDDDICFSYTPLDRYHVHNASMMAAAVLVRTSAHNRDLSLRERGLKALKFTAKHQNEDGSWFYWAPPNKITGKIDNFHTGFVLEAIETIRKNLNTDFEFDHILQKGMDFYIKNFFEGGMAKMTPEKTFPIDIQSCAQSIITLGELEPRFPHLKEIKEKIARWTMQNMLDEEGYFYYRIYKNRRIDKTPYIRWGECWMMLALTYLFSEQNK